MKKRKLFYLVSAILILWLAGIWLWSSTQLAIDERENQGQPRFFRGFLENLALDLFQGVGNSKRFDVAGKVVDQNGEPIPGVSVNGGVLLVVSPTTSRSERYDTQTDIAGKFQFVNINGAGFAFGFQKPGYEYGGRVSWGENYTPDPNNPTVFTMWKLRGAEPMVHVKVHDYIPCDGTEVHYDLETGKKVASGGDLVVKLTRTPVDIVRSKHFDWKASVEIVNGGLVEIKDLYPYMAPAEGYKPTLTIMQDAAAKDWTAAYTASFYFNANNGKAFGRMTIQIQADFQPPPTLFNAEIYLNPTTSRNLEFDRTKEIKPSSQR